MFEHSKKEIEELKKKDPNCGVTYNVSVNEYSDLTQEERKKFLTGAIHIPIEEDKDSIFYDFELDMPISYSNHPSV